MTDNKMTDEMRNRYQRVQTLLQGSGTRGRGELMPNARLFPVWMDDGDYFFYDKIFAEAKEYRCVDVTAQTNTLAFNHQQLAQALAETTGEKVDHQRLPITVEAMTFAPRTIRFSAFEQDWEYADDSGSLQTIESQENGLLSPDGQQLVFCRDYNLWLRDCSSGTERALTQDGECNFEYEKNGALQVRWSPDSNKLLAVQTDHRALNSPVIDLCPDDGAVRPIIDTTTRVPYRGEALPVHQLKIIDIQQGKTIEPDYPPVLESYETFGAGFFCAEGTRPMSTDKAWWSGNSQTVYLADMPRGDKSISVVAFDMATGQAKTLFTEETQTYIRQKPDVEYGAIHLPLPETDELIWWSECSGWGHLYLYDLNTGELKRQLTQGDWLVRDITHFDAQRRELIIQTGGREPGRDPYYRDIAKVDMDTGELTTLVSSDHTYMCHGRVPDYVTFEGIEQVGANVRGASPSGDYLVATRSRVDDVPVTLLFDRTGKELMTIETADQTAMPAAFPQAERVKMLAADGQTAIYGTLYRPSDFDPTKTYPILEVHYPNPGYAWTPKDGFAGTVDKILRAHAELGLITLAIDGRGTPGRSKAFYDDSYGNVSSVSNIDDRVAGIKQLAERYPYMDTTRVGIIGHRGSGPVYALLERPDFYTVGINFMFQDMRLFFSYFPDRFEGVEASAKTEQRYYDHHLHKLKGKLLLVHAVGSAVSGIGHSLRLANKLSEANRDFDLLILKGMYGEPPSYAWRRRLDYLVQHLLGETPPQNFKLDIPLIF